MKIYTINRLASGGSDTLVAQGLAIHIRQDEEARVRNILSQSGFTPEFLVSGCVDTHEVKFTQLDGLPEATVYALRSRLEAIA